MLKNVQIFQLWEDTPRITSKINGQCSNNSIICTKMFWPSSKVWENETKNCLYTRYAFGDKEYHKKVYCKVESSRPTVSVISTRKHFQFVYEEEIWYVHTVNQNWIVDRSTACNFTVRKFNTSFEIYLIQGFIKIFKQIEILQQYPFELPEN